MGYADCDELDQAAEELFEEVGGYGGAVAGGGADVVDGVGFGGEGGAGVAEGCIDVCWGERGVGEGCFGGVEADGAVGQARGGEVDFCDGLFIEKGDCG